MKRLSTTVCSVIMGWAVLNAQPPGMAADPLSEPQAAAANAARASLDIELDLFLRAMDQMFSTDNSAIHLRGKSLDRAASFGLPIVPLAARRMADLQLPTDAFARLYCLCNAVLVRAGQNRVFWEGGTDSSPDSHGTERFTRIGPVWWEDGEEDAKLLAMMFRQQVLGDIAAKYFRARNTAILEQRKQTGDDMPRGKSR